MTGRQRKQTDQPYRVRLIAEVGKHHIDVPLDQGRSTKGLSLHVDDNERRR
jgi:hypothetical protein